MNTLGIIFIVILVLFGLLVLFTKIYGRLEAVKKSKLLELENNRLDVESDRLLKESEKLTALAEETVRLVRLKIEESKSCSVGEIEEITFEIEAYNKRLKNLRNLIEANRKEMEDMNLEMNALIEEYKGK